MELLGILSSFVDWHLIQLVMKLFLSLSDVHISVLETVHLNVDEDFGEILLEGLQ